MIPPAQKYFSLSGVLDPSESSSHHAYQQPATDLAKSNKQSLREALNLPIKPSSDFTPRPWVVGHRGALYRELENTLAGFQLCADLGCDAVELDVFLVDKTLICFHGGGTDQNPGDLTEYCLDQVGRSILDCRSFDETQALVFNPEMQEFVCPTHQIETAKIPTLRSVLELARDTDMVIKIELKGAGTTVPVLQLVEELGVHHLCHYSSFDHCRIELVREMHPERGQDGLHVYKTGALFDSVPSDFIARAQAVGASEVHLRYDTCTVERVLAIHEAGMNSMAWLCGPRNMKRHVAEKYKGVGNEDVIMYETIIETCVEQICCNRPDFLLELLEQKNQMDA